MSSIEQFESELTDNDPFPSLHADLVRNDNRMLDELVALRKRKGLTQDEVATRMNRSKTAVSNFERLGADPHLSTIRRYAAAIGAKITSDVHDFEDLQRLFDNSAIEVFLKCRAPMVNRPRCSSNLAELDWTPA